MILDALVRKNNALVRKQDIRRQCDTAPVRNFNGKNTALVRIFCRTSAVLFTDLINGALVRIWKTLRQSEFGKHCLSPTHVGLEQCFPSSDLRRLFFFLLFFSFSFFSFLFCCCCCCCYVLFYFVLFCLILLCFVLFYIHSSMMPPHRYHMRRRRWIGLLLRIWGTQVRRTFLFTTVTPARICENNYAYFSDLIK